MHAGRGRTRRRRGPPLGAQDPGQRLLTSVDVTTKRATAVDNTINIADQSTTHTGARKRLDQTLVGQLNLEWAQLRTRPTDTTWTAWPALAECATLADVEAHAAASDRQSADEILLALLELTAAGDRLAGRTVLQLMLGKAVRIAASHTGRADRDTLEQLAVAALWDVIATYPIERRRQKVAANLAMDTLRQVVAEFGYDRHESPVEADVLTAVAPDVDDTAVGTVVDAELFEVLAWGIDTGVITQEDGALLTAVYCPGPDNPGRAHTAALFGLTWAAARQRCSRAVRKLAAAVQADTAEMAAVA